MTKFSQLRFSAFLFIDVSLSHEFYEKNSSYLFFAVDNQ